MVTSLHFPAMLIWLAPLAGSPKHTQEKLELWGSHEKSTVRSRMAVAPCNDVTQPAAERGRLIPSFRGRNWGSGNFSHLFKVIQLMRGGDDNQTPAASPLTPRSATPCRLQPREAERLSAQLRSPAHACYMLSPYKVPALAACFTCMVLSSLRLPSEVCILNLIWQLKRLGLREVKVT